MFPPVDHVHVFKLDAMVTDHRMDALSPVVNDNVIDVRHGSKLGC
jgi:hypothetical protein